MPFSYKTPRRIETSQSERAFAGTAYPSMNLTARTFENGQKWPRYRKSSDRITYTGMCRQAADDSDFWTPYFTS
jgi:hypothetical protein